MARTIRLSITTWSGSDAPTVDGLLDQARDYFELLKGIEEAVADDGRQAIEWRIVSATTNSPITFEAAAFSRDVSADIERRAGSVTRHAALGLRQLQTRAERPAFFTNAVLQRAERMFERIANGPDRTVVDYGADLPPMDLTPLAARTAATHARGVLRPVSKPCREQGSVEGFVRSIEQDGFGRALLWIRHRLTGDSVKCLINGDALSFLETHLIKDVWRNRRVQIYGVLHYTAAGQLSQVEATDIVFLRDGQDLPGVDEVLDKEFTGGLRSEEYLERLHDGSLS